MSLEKITYTKFMNRSYPQIMNGASALDPLRAEIRDDEKIYLIKNDKIISKFKNKNIDDTNFNIGDKVYVWGSTCVDKDGLHQEARKRYESRKEWDKLKEKYQNNKQSNEQDNVDGFWDSYTIPFEYTTAIKGRIGQLSVSSSGTGRARNTVTHLYTLEAFEDGRLKRSSLEYLCGGSAKIPLDDKDKDDLPNITCKKCLKYMERWK